MKTALQALPRRVSLVAQTVSVLKDAIRSGRWQRWLPGEHELCGLLHVSRVTLRSALKELERERWLQAGQGRRRRVVARRRPVKADAAAQPVVLLTPEPLSALPAFAIFWMDSLREQLSEANFRLEVHASRGGYGTRSENALDALAARVKPAVWVLYRSTYEMQRWFAAKRFPCIITGTRHPGITLPSVDIDYRATCRHAAGQFIARGHRQLVLLNPATGTGGELESEQGFQEAQSRSGATGVHVSIVRHDGTVPGICLKLEALFHHSPPPTALLVSRPVHVLTVMGYLLKHGIRVPDGGGAPGQRALPAIISRDDDAFLEHVVPQVARYSSRPALFAQKLSRLVLDAAAGRILPSTDLRLMPHLLPGETFR